MKSETKKFVKWLLLADLIMLVVIIVLGAIFIKDNHYERGRMLGAGFAQFLIFSNGAAVLIRLAILKRKENS